MNMQFITRYDLPGWWNDSDVRRYIIHSDWDAYERDMTYRELSLRARAESWLHEYGEDVSECRIKEARLDLQALEDTPFHAKPSIDIRATKTREYRKRRPKAMRYSPDTAMNLALMLCFLNNAN